MLDGEILGILNTYTQKGEEHNPQGHRFLKAVIDILANRIFVLQQTKKILKEKEA